MALWWWATFLLTGEAIDNKFTNEQVEKFISLFGVHRRFANFEKRLTFLIIMVRLRFNLG